MGAIEDHWVQDNVGQDKKKSKTLELHEMEWHL